MQHQPGRTVRHVRCVSGTLVSSRRLARPAVKEAVLSTDWTKRLTYTPIVHHFVHDEFVYAAVGEMLWRVNLLGARTQAPRDVGAVTVTLLGWSPAVQLKDVWRADKHVEATQTATLLVSEDQVFLCLGVTRAIGKYPVDLDDHLRVLFVGTLNGVGTMMLKWQVTYTTHVVGK